MKFKIREGTIDEVVALSLKIPEFNSPHPAEVYKQRLDGRVAIISIAEIKNEWAGFKVGYDKFNDNTFYSWMGGVLPQFRKIGIASALASVQEQFALKHGYSSLLLKTRNKHKAMLHFAINSGFEIMEVVSKPDPSENRILLRKLLKN